MQQKQFLGSWVLGFFGFDRTGYSNIKKGRKWYEELREERTRDVETEMI
jgi:hypothetical protein